MIPRSSALYPLGGDLAWIALDRDDQVGVFITAGYGPIPKAVLKASLMDEGVEKQLIDEIEELLLHKLPLITKVCLVVGEGDPESFIELAKRGLFVYDWNSMTSTYEKVAFPARAFLPEFSSVDILELAAGQKLEAVDFSITNIIDVRDHLVCEEYSR